MRAAQETTEGEAPKGGEGEAREEPAKSGGMLAAGGWFPFAIIFVSLAMAIGLAVRFGPPAFPHSTYARASTSDTAAYYCSRPAVRQCLVPPILWIAHDRTVLQKWLEKKGDLKRGSGSDGAGDYGAVANSSVDHVEAAAL